MRKLEVVNPRICKFYEANPGINFEAVNLIFIDLFDKLLYDMDHTMTTSINTQLLSAMNDQNVHIHEMRHNINSLKDTVCTMNTDHFAKTLAKFTDLKKDYIEDLKNIINSNTYDKIAPLLEKNNNILIDKTTLVVNDAIPKSQSQVCSKINESLTVFYKSISDDTTHLLKSVDNSSIKEFITNFEIKSALMLQNVQQPIYSFISASEDRINNNINTMKDGSVVTQNANQKIMGELNDILSNFRNSGSNVLQNRHLSGILTKMYNSAEISTPHPGTILLKRIRKQNVLIQNNDSEQNVGVDDINSFMHLIDQDNCSGIFISQQSGISTKQNYQIEMHNNNVIVFVHNAEYSPAKIEVAVNIIDSLSMKLRQFKGRSDDDCTIPKDILDIINNEYQLFITQKNAVIEVFKESQKKVLAQIDEIRFPALDKYLSTKYSAPIQKPGLKCELCKSFSANNLKALAAHKRGCLRKHPVAIKPNITQNTVTVPIGSH